jgi:predicted nucleic acid-binding protein
VYLIDTNVISEARKGVRANPGVRQFFQQTTAANTAVFLSVVTVGELRRGIESVRYRGDTPQAERLEAWLNKILLEYQDCILGIDDEIAQVWGRLRVPHHENALDKQIAATALIHDLTVVTRNRKDYRQTYARTLDPFVE